MIGVNLLEPPLRPERSRFRVERLVVVAVALVAIAPPVVTRWRLNALRYEVREWRERASQVRVSQGAARTRQDTERRAREAQQRWQAVAGPDPAPPGALLAEVARALPGSTWLSRVEAGAGSLTLSGQAAGASAVVELLQRLGPVAGPGAPRLVALEQTGPPALPGKAGKELRFTIRLTRSSGDAVPASPASVAGAERAAEPG